MKKFLSLILCAVLILSLAACSDTMKGAKDDAESIGESVVDSTKNAIDNTKSELEKDTDGSLNLMAGITAKDALKAALKHANLTEDQVSNVDVDLDRDNGKLIYEVDFNSGVTEYDYDINAETGEVISADKSMD